MAAALSALPDQLGPRLREKASWRAIRDAYTAFVSGRPEQELAETFFNSVTRRLFHTVGIDPEMEFVRLAEPPPRGHAAITEVVRATGSAEQLVDELLGRHPFAVGYLDRARDARLAAPLIAGLRPEAVELARPAFYRNKAAYLVGRLLRGEEATPVVFALLNPEGRVRLDAVLLGENACSVVFSFTRSYFFVDVQRPRELVAFLRALMPWKPLGELYNAIGRNKHGKTEQFRELIRRIEGSEERFDVAPGARGMVMSVFTHPAYDVVFKVIKDSFDYPKTTTRAEVMDSYQLVFRHDRAGRLVEAAEFEHLSFDAARFTPRLLETLLRDAKETVSLRGSSVVFRHLYTERRLKPLDLYLREAEPAAARRATLDFGQALKDLAASNIFPGDLLLKNFGVTRLGRVVFYDYDEVCLLTDCNFRELPAARSDDEETAGEAWYYVAERDIFPEELLRFLGLLPPLKEAFVAAHGDLLGVGFWTRMQQEHRSGHVLDIFPYVDEQRLHGN